MSGNLKELVVASRDRLAKFTTELITWSSLEAVGGFSFTAKSMQPPELQRWTSQRICLPSSLCSAVESKGDDATVVRNMKVRLFPTRMQSEWIVKCQDGLRALRNIAIEMVHRKWLNVYQITSKMVSIEGRRCEFINGTRVLDEFDVLPPWRRTKAMENHSEKWRAIDEVPYKFSKNHMRQLKIDYETNFKKLAMGLIKKFSMKFISNLETQTW